MAKGLGVHVLTGPIYVEGAAPGDALEVRVLDLEFRVPYGVNNTGPGSGVLPDLFATPTPRIIKTDLQRKVALLPGGIELPLSPFLGIMGVAPPPDLIIVSSGPPGNWGGNLDLRTLTVGATLYLPVFNDGALFYTGDPHGVQGDGEVDGGALEQSLTATLQFILHKGAGQIHARAARRGCSELLRHGPGPRSQHGDEERGARDRSNSCRRRPASPPRRPIRSRAWAWTSGWPRPSTASS